MRADRDDRAGAGGDGSVRGHMHHHGHAAGAHRLDHIEGRDQVSARGVQLDDEDFSVPLFGGLDAALKIIEHHGRDRPIGVHHEHQRPVALGRNRLNEERQHSNGDQEQADVFHVRDYNAYNCFMKRFALLCGPVGPFLFAGMLTALTLLQFDFLRGLGWDPLRAPTFDWPSGNALGPYGIWMTATFLLCGMMMTLFALRLRADLPPVPVSTVGSALLALAGLALMGLAFTTDPTLRFTPATWHGRLHDASFVLLGLTLLPAMLTLGRAFQLDPRWRSLSAYTWLTVALAIPTFVLKGAAFYIFLLAVLTWSEVLAIRSSRFR